MLTHKITPASCGYGPHELHFVEFDPSIERELISFNVTIYTHSAQSSWADPTC